MTQAIVIVEDSDSVAPLEIALGALGRFSVLLFSDGRELLKLLGANSVEIVAIVTDLHLPHIDGFELIRTIRADERYSRLPIVVVSGDSQPELPERLRVLGATAFFRKPYSPAEIRHTLKELLHVP